MMALKTRLRSRPQDQAGGANRAVTLYARARLIGHSMAGSGLHQVEVELDALSGLSLF